MDFKNDQIYPVRISKLNFNFEYLDHLSTSRAEHRPEIGQLYVRTNVPKQHQK